MHARSRQPGFTLIEIVAAIMIIAAVAGVILVAASGRLRLARGARVAADIASIQDGIAAFRTDVGRYPRRITHLDEPITTAARDICGNAYAAVRVSRWRGPYLDRDMSAAGTTTASGMIQDSLRRAPATAVPSTAYGTMTLDVLNVDSMDAAEVERTFDSAYDFAAGTVRWTNTGNGLGTVNFVMPIGGC